MFERALRFYRGGRQRPSRMDFRGEETGGDDRIAREQRTRRGRFGGNLYLHFGSPARVPLVPFTNFTFTATVARRFSFVRSWHEPQRFERRTFRRAFRNSKPILYAQDNASLDLDPVDGRSAPSSMSFRCLSQTFMLCHSHTT